MAEFGCVEPFDIDDGELDGLTPQQCFVLGYELADISRRAELLEDSFGALVHSSNRERIERALQKRGRDCRFGWAGDDRSESWMHLWVAPKG